MSDGFVSPPQFRSCLYTTVLVCALVAAAVVAPDAPWFGVCVVTAAFMALPLDPVFFYPLMALATAFGSMLVLNLLGGGLVA